MACLPCQKRAEARRQAMLKQVAEKNPQAAKAFEANTQVTSSVTATRVLPRYEGKWVPITNNTMKPKTIWNEAYQAFTINRSK